MKETAAESAFSSGLGEQHNAVLDDMVFTGTVMQIEKAPMK